MSTELGFELGRSIDTRFWMLISPVLPVGGYSYSHGLESAVAKGWIGDATSCEEWIRTLASRVLVELELPLLIRLLEACDNNDQTAARHWNDLAHATRETTELLLEEKAKGEALTRLFPALEISPSVRIDSAGFTAAFAQACSFWQIPSSTALQGYAWAWFEMLVAAAIKLVPLGHSDGQRLLLRFNGQLEEFSNRATEIDDDAIGATSPGLAILSSEHETQHGRVFRS